MATKFISSQYTTLSVGPLIVSGLLGKASMLLPLTKSIFVFCGLKTMPGGSLWVNAAMRAMILLV